MSGTELQIIHVLLVDDHPVVRSGIRSLLEAARDITIVGEAGEGTEALRLAEQLAPDVILLDMEMPGMSGVEVARRLQQTGSQARILVLSAHDDPQYVQELFSIGASGYLMKEEAPEMIIKAIQGVARGEQGWISRRVASRVTHLIADEPKNRRDLTPREEQVLQEIVAGKTNQEIGFALGISEKTIEKHMVRILSKLGVNSRVEAAVLAVREGLI